MRLSRCSLAILLLVLAAGGTVQASTPLVPEFVPDPYSVQRYGPAYRYPQAGWIVLHIEGAPYERGYQHGRLLAPEIAAYVRCFAATQSPKAPADGWRNTRSLINALFVRRYDREYLEEMKGIADGATAAGARFDRRPIDLTDIVAINSLFELESLDSALEATATGLEGMRFPHTQPQTSPPPKPMHCSAFAATGPATADGKIVFGHITMGGLYASNYANVWLDVKPAQGHRVLMQTYPGGIQSGMDYYLNDAGLLVTETTLAQTKFDITGLALASRIRQTMQYADSIDKAVEILGKSNNGLYTNEWLMGDIKTNEIAMFALGTHKTKLSRSSKNEWFGGTEGFYWGCNNTKDLDVRLETIPGVEGRPANMCFCPSDRDKMWVRLYNQHKGKIDANFGMLAFTTPPLAAHSSSDAKFTTTDMARELKSYALFGAPLGRTWKPTFEQRRDFPEIRPLVGNPWTILSTNPPAKAAAANTVVMDLPDPASSHTRSDGMPDEDNPVVTAPAWHGTILPKTDADIWLASAFARYERIVAREKAQRDPHGKAGNENAEPSTSARERLAVELYAYRSSYLAGARAAADVALAKTHADVGQSDWFRVASGKGVLVMQELRHLLGDAVFEEVMDTFGREWAGKQVTVAQFQAHAERLAHKPLKEFFAYWLQQTGLPSLRLGKVTVASAEKAFQVEGEILRDDKAPATTVEVTIESAKGEQTSAFVLNGPRTPFTVKTPTRPVRVVVDKYGRTAKTGGGVYAVLSFHEELENTLIVYGTADETNTNREAAEELQRAIIERHSNFTVPFKSDKEVTDEDLKTHHLVLIGRPDSNSVIKRFRANLPITFGSRSFTVGNDTYAHALTAVFAAAANPLNPRYSLVVVSGLSGESTLQAAPRLVRLFGLAEVVLLPNNGKQRMLALPPKELIQELGQGTDVTRRD